MVIFSLRTMYMQSDPETREYSRLEMVTFLRTFRDDGIYAQLAEGGVYMIAHPLHSIYPLSGRVTSPPVTLPSKTGEIQLPVLCHIAPLPFSLILTAI